MRRNLFIQQERKEKIVQSNNALNDESFLPLAALSLCIWKKKTASSKQQAAKEVCRGNLQFSFYLTFVSRNNFKKNRNEESCSLL
jgi:hypothetical protein